MPAGIYCVDKGKYELIKPCSLDKVLQERHIKNVLHLKACASPKYSCVDPQGWPIPGGGIPAQTWHLNERQLLGIAVKVACVSHPKDRQDPGNGHVPREGEEGVSHLKNCQDLRWVTNITPNRKSKGGGGGTPIAFLAEIKEVWGYRYLCWRPTGCWTPIMIKFKTLWLDQPLSGPGFVSPKKSSDPVPEFPVPPKKGRTFFEFFYIDRRGKLATSSRYSQAVLFPDALEYFLREMRKSLLAPPEECGEGRDIVCP